MKLPISFEDFKSNPVGAIAFCLILAVGYLFYELRSTHEEQLQAQESRIETLEQKIGKYEDKLDEMNQKLLECLELNQ